MTPDDLPNDPSDIIDDEIWEEIYVEQHFDFHWPPLRDDEGNTISETVIKVDAAFHSGVTYNLIGVRGAYSYIELFEPEIKFVSINRYGKGNYNYLYQFNPNPFSFKLVSYYCTYDEGTIKNNIIRVWQNYDIGRDWIKAQVAREKAHDAEYQN